jgi:hypothetical protein
MESPLKYIDKLIALHPVLISPKIEFQTGITFENLHVEPVTNENELFKFVLAYNKSELLTVLICFVLDSDDPENQKIIYSNVQNIKHRNNSGLMKDKEDILYDTNRKMIQAISMIFKDISDAKISIEMWDLIKTDISNKAQINRAVSSIKPLT